MILAGDIGGTKAQLALMRPRWPLCPYELRTYPTRAYSDPFSLLRDYLSTVEERPEVISLAVAGPVLQGEVYMVNVGWRFSEQDLKEAFPAAKETLLLNDLEALAFAIPYLPEKGLFQIKPGTCDPQGNIAVIAAGTGLGEAFLIRRRSLAPVPVATEGGHADFFPFDDLTWGLRKFLAERFGHVSLERVVSGPGLENIYQFLCAREGRAPELASAQEIGQAGLQGVPLPRKALEIWATIYGAEAGNLALKCLATGGVFLGGGIAPKLLPLLKEGPFLKAFLEKGRLKSFLEGLSIFVIIHEYPVLLGAALYAYFQGQKASSEKFHSDAKVFCSSS